jgi:hypothetical protein
MTGVTRGAQNAKSAVAATLVVGVHVFLCACGSSSSVPGATGNTDAGRETGSADGAGLRTDAGSTDAPAGRDADVGPGFLPCGSDVCDLTTSECCDPFFPDDAGPPQCQPLTQGCSSLSSSQTCEGNADCPAGQVCCTAWVDVGSPTSGCGSACGLSGSVRACRDDAECGDGGTCIACTLCSVPDFPFHVCIGPNSGDDSSLLQALCTGSCG